MPRYNRVLVIINPRSGRLKVRQQLFDIASCFSENGCETTVFTTRGKGDALRYAADMSDRFDAVVCRGGDGTLNEVVNGVMRAKVRRPIGYLPAGTSNDFAHTMGIPAVGRKAVELIVNGTPKPHDIALFNDERYLNYTASFGVFTKASYATPQGQKNLFGYGAYLYAGAKDFTSVKPIPCKVTCDGKVYEGDYIFGSITNSLAVGGFLHYDPKDIRFDDGIFEMILVTKPNSAKEWYDLISGAHKQRLDERFITSIKGKEFTIEGSQKIAWSLDGEFGGEHRLSTLKVIQNGVEIIRQA